MFGVVGAHPLCEIWDGFGSGAGSGKRERERVVEGRLEVCVEGVDVGCAAEEE